MIGKMMATDEKMIRSIGGSLCAFFFYSLFFWRTFKSNPGNRVVECASLTLIVFIAFVFLCNPGDLPDWVFGLWLVLIVLLCFTTLFFVVQRIYRSLCRDKNK
jgi:hypothetical protein